MEILIRAINSTTPNDPVKSARGCYKRGDLIDVRGDGFNWGDRELWAPANGGVNVVVKVPGVTRAQFRTWVINNWQCEPDGPDTLDPEQPPTRRRRLRIKLDDLPNNVRNTLNNTGQFTTTWAAFRDFIENKRTLATATGATL